jgi:hypothetical protein
VDTASGSASRSADGSAWPREDLEQPGTGVEPVVEAVPALLEERVAAHFARQRRADFLHLALDERVARLPKQRTPPWRTIHGFKLRVDLTS